MSLRGWESLDLIEGMKPSLDPMLGTFSCAVYGLGLAPLSTSKALLQILRRTATGVGVWTLHMCVYIYIYVYIYMYIYIYMCMYVCVITCCCIVFHCDWESYTLSCY